MINKNYQTKLEKNGYFFNNTHKNSTNVKTHLFSHKSNCTSILIEDFCDGGIYDYFLRIEKNGNIQFKRFESFSKLLKNI